MWTRKAWSCHFCHRTFLSLIMHAVNFNYNFFHFNNCHIFKIPNFSLKFIFFTKKSFVFRFRISNDEREEQKTSPHNQHWFKWMKKTGKKQQRLKNDFDEHEINKSCRSSCQMPWMIRFSSNNFNQLLFSSIFFSNRNHESAILIVWFILIFNFVHITKLCRVFLSRSG